MPEEQICPNCGKPVEAGATFCGNCGHKMVATNPAQPIAPAPVVVSAPPQPTAPVEPAAPAPVTPSQVYMNGPAPTPAPPITPVPTMATANNVPAYAVPHGHHKQHWAAMALALGALGIAGGVLIPIVGICFGVAGIVLATSSYRVTHGWLKIAGLVASILALLVGIAFWVIAIIHVNQSQSNLHAGTSGGAATIKVTTACYSFSFNSQFNVNNSSGSCTLNAYSGSSFQTSTNVYKVVATQTSTVNDANFNSFSKQSIESDISKNIPGASITNAASTQFSGSPAYYVQAYDITNGVALIEESVLHGTSSSKDNLFVLVHAVNGQNADLSELQQNWTWN